MKGVRVGSFVLEEPLATGGMGAVWRASHRSGQAAIKFIPAAIGEVGGLDAAAGLRAEIRAVGALDHPNIVRVYDSGVLGPEHERASGGELRAGRPWLAMELAEGAVDDLLETMDWPLARDLLLQLLDGLAHAHARGVIHRDLKPGNVLYTRSEGHIRALMADFGLAWVVRGTDPASHGGTLAYAAPEQILGLPAEQGPWSDLYALGCTAFRLVTGRRPYRGLEGEDLRRAHLFSPPPRPTLRFAVPDGFEPWLHGLLAKDPRERFQRAADAAWALVRLPEPDAPEQTEEAPGPPPAPRSGTLPLADWARGDWPEPEGPAARVRPPLPPDWGPDEPGSPARGLGLFGLSAPPMTGRHEERDRLWDALGRASAPRVVVLRGPAGVGKSRLAAWLVERAHEVGAAETFRGSFGADPGRALARLLEESLRTRGLGGADLLRHLRTTLGEDGDPAEAEALARLLRPADPELSGAPVHDRLPLARRAIGRATDARAAVVWLDDAHASPEAIAFAEHVVARGAGLRALVVLTVREDLLAEPLALRLDAAVATSGGLDLRVGPLPRGLTAHLVRSMLPVKGDLAERIETVADGLPLVAVELVADLVRQGKLRGDRGGIWLEAPDALPGSLDVLWAGAVERLVALEPAAQQALEVAAVLGFSFTQSEWRDAGQRIGAAPSTRLVGRLVDQGLIVPERGGGRFSFSHALLRDTLLQHAGRLRGVHLACAEVLEGHGGPAAARAAAHFEAAGAFSRAAESYLRALRWLSERDRDRALEVATAWAEALGRVAVDTDPRWAQGHEILVDLYGPEGGEAHQEAVEALLLRGHGDLRAEVRGMIELARVDLRQLEHGRAEARAELAWRRSRGTALRPLAAAVRAEVRRLQGDVLGAERLLRAELVDHPAQPVLLQALARALCDQGRAGDALEELEAAGPAERTPVDQARLDRARGNALLGLGRADQAVAVLRRARDRGDRAGFNWPSLELDLARAEWAAGEIAAARDRWVRLLPRLDAAADPRRRAEVLVALASTGAGPGAWFEAADHLDALESLPAEALNGAARAHLVDLGRRAEAAGEVALARRAQALSIATVPVRDRRAWRSQTPSPTG